MKKDDRLAHIKLLIVDDERMIQRLVHDVLNSLGFQYIKIASSGRAAIELVTNEDFDLIITDWRMQDINGLDFVRFLRDQAHTPKGRIPIIFLTGNAEARDVCEARDAGVNEYLIKPFTVQQLIKKVRNIVDNPRRFIEATTYKGPCRRHKNEVVYSKDDRRKR